MRVLLTGVAGFVGSHLADALLDKGFQVIGVDNLITGSNRNLAHLKDNPRFCFIEHDATYPLRLKEDLGWVMHFASPASPPKYLAKPIETLRVNSEGTYHLLELAREKNASFFFSSTSEIYGDPEIHPQREDYWGHVHCIGPRSVYDEGKRYAEALITTYHKTYNLPVRIIRIFNTYGPRMDAEDGRVVTNLVNQSMRHAPLTIYGAGTQTRSFQFISDLIEGILKLMEVPYSKPVNLGNPDEYTMLDLVKLIKNLTQSKSEIVFRSLPEDDPKRRKPDISLAKKLLNWEPQIPLQKGLLETIRYFQSL